MGSSVVRDGVRFTDEDFEVSKTFSESDVNGRIVGFKQYTKAKNLRSKNVSGSVLKKDEGDASTVSSSSSNINFWDDLGIERID